VLECVVNVSEGKDSGRLAALAALVGADLLDVHTDADHHRSVFTMVGTQAPRTLARAAVERLDIGSHAGVHPRVGVVDVVPFVALEPTTFDAALVARDEFARFAATELGVPCFLYGPERSLPEVRRRAFRDLAPDVGPATPHPTAGAMCVGARDLLVAYNVWLAGGSLESARTIAREIRSPEVRALGLQVGEFTQVSMNLVDPLRVGPDVVYDFVAARAPVVRAELVGLVPARVLAPIPRGRWEQLDLSAERTIESRVSSRVRAR